MEDQFQNYINKAQISISCCSAINLVISCQNKLGKQLAKYYVQPNGGGGSGGELIWEKHYQGLIFLIKIWVAG